MSTILELARCVRNWGFQNRKRLKVPSDLTGLCAIASAHLYQLLKNEGINAKLVGNDGHVFLLVDNKILDVTATQFNSSVGFYRANNILPEILFCEKTKISEYTDDIFFWRIEYTFESLEELCAWQDGWLEEQCVNLNWDKKFINNYKEYAF